MSNSNVSRECSAPDRRFYIVAAGVTLVVMIAMVWINVYVRSRRHFQEGEAYFREDKFIEAITSYESAAHAYTPGNRNVARSLDRLWEIGEILEEEYTDPMYPLIAYRSLRSSVYAIRSFYMPYREWIPRCDEKIKSLVEIQLARQSLPETAGE